MKKCMSGAARLGVGFGIAVMFFSLVMLYTPPTSAASAGTVRFNTSIFYTESVAVITLTDSDLTAGTQSVKVNSTTCPNGFTLSLLNNSGTFNETITFTTTGTCASPILKVSDGDTIWVTYDDADTAANITNSSTFDYTENATIRFNQTIYGTSGTGNITVVDNDTNTDSTDWDTVTVTIKATSSDASIIVTLNETPSDLVYGNNTGIFYGTFNFSTTTSSIDVVDVLGASEGDIIWVYYNDTKNTYGNAVNATNTSSMAVTATVSFGASGFYTDSTAYVSVNDNDTTVNTNWLQNDTVVVNITSEYDPDGINVTLTETDNNTGIFNGTFTFNYSGSSNNVTKVLAAFNGNKINVTYVDPKNGTGNTSMNITNTTTFYNRVTATVSLNRTYYGPESIARITVTDNDSAVNADPANPESVNIFVNTTSNTTGITVSLLENADDSGIFMGNFTFNVSGTTDDSADIINASDLNQIVVIYTDMNSSGYTLNISDNATFYNSVTGDIDFNATFLNTTESAYPANATVFLNVTDNDTYTNTNASNYQEFNVTVRNMDTGCTINVTLNETGADTGVFNGTFTLNETTCSDALNIMRFTAGGEDYLNITYIDNRNGTADSNATISNLTLADDMAPVFGSVYTPDSDLTYRVGDVVNITVDLDQPGANLTANFSSLDSGYSVDDEDVRDYGNSSYFINYTITSGNTREQDQYPVNITAYDGMVNGPTSQNYTITLSRLSINESLIDFSTLSPNGSQEFVFNIENQGSVTQYNMTRYIDIYRDANLSYNTDLNQTRTLYFMLPQNTSRITFSIESNHTSTILNSSIYDNSSVLQSSSLSGTIYPSVLRDSAEVWYAVVTTANVTPSIRLTPNIRVYINTSNWFTSNLMAGADNFSNNANTTINLTLAVPILNVLPSIYNGTIIYNNSNTSVSASVTFNITGPSVWYESNSSSPVKTLPNGTVTVNVNLMRDFKTLKIDVNNTGNVNLTGLTMNLSSGTTEYTNFTDASNRSMNLSVVAGNDGSSTANRHSMSFPEVSPRSSAWIKLHFNSSEQTTEGLYITYLNIYSTNGQPFNESNLTLRINLTKVLNVTVLNITYNSSSAKPRPGDNVTVNLSVKYQNSDAVTGLSLANFTIYDTWTNGSGSIRNRTLSNLTVDNFSQNGAGIYMFNYTVPPRVLGAAEYEMHSIILEVRAPNNNTGNGTSTYNMSAPNMTISFNSFERNMNNGTHNVFTISISNNGTATVYNVSINFTKNGSVTCIALNVSSCPVIANLTANQAVTACSVLVTANSSTCTDNVTFKAGGVSIYGNIYNATPVSKLVEVAMTSSSSNGGTTGGSGSDAATCASDSVCSALYFCNSTSYCERISCTDGFIADHRCISYTYSIGILSSGPSISVMLDSLNNTYINVNNTGNTSTINTELNLSEVTVSVSPGYKLLSSRANYTFNVTVSASNDTKLGSYSGTFMAYKSNNKSINDTISFTVVVIPNKWKMGEINYTYENYTLIVEGMADELERIKAIGLVSVENLTVAERFVNITKAVLNEIEAAIDAGDYAKADSLLLDLKTYIGEARNALDNLELEQKRGIGESQGSLILWIVIGIVLVVIAGFLVYMFLPSLATPKYGISKPVPRPGGSVLDKLKGISRGRGFKKPKPMASKLKDYARGYARHRSFRYKHKEGIGGKLKKLIKRGK